MRKRFRLTKKAPPSFEKEEARLRWLWSTALPGASAWGITGEAKSRIDKALLLLRGLEDSYYKAHALINAGLLANDLQTHIPGQETALVVLASEAFTEAVRVSQAMVIRGHSPMLMDQPL